MLDLIKKKYTLSADDLKRLYYDNDEISNDSLQNLADLLGDVYFVEGIHRTVKIQVKKSCASTYLYKYAYDKGVSFLKSDHQIKKISGEWIIYKIPYI